MKKITIIATVLGIFLISDMVGVFSLSATADTITFSFTGVYEHPLGNIDATGLFGWDTNAPDQQPADETFGFYLTGFLSFKLNGGYEYGIHYDNESFNYSLSGAQTPGNLFVGTTPGGAPQLTMAVFANNTLGYEQLLNVWGGFLNGDESLPTDLSDNYMAALRAEGRIFWFTSLAVVPPAESVPEPGTIILLSSGLLGLWGFRRKFKK
jgi:hypothetical protein